MTDVRAHPTTSRFDDPKTGRRPVQRDGVLGSTRVSALN